MALSTFTMIPSVFVSATKVTGLFVGANQVTLLPTGLQSRGQRVSLRGSRLMRMHETRNAMPEASWPVNRRPGRSDCSQSYSDRLTAKHADKAFAG